MNKVLGQDQCAVVHSGICFSGDILQEAVRQLQPGVKVGKILIQRDETTPDKLPQLYYKKLPRDIADCFVILVDPMLATAGINQAFQFSRPFQTSCWGKKGRRQGNVNFNARRILAEC